MAEFLGLAMDLRLFITRIVGCCGFLRLGWISRCADVVCVEHWLNRAREVLSWAGFQYNTEYTAPGPRRELRETVTYALCREAHLA